MGVERRGRRPRRGTNSRRQEQETVRAHPPAVPPCDRGSAGSHRRYGIASLCALGSRAGALPRGCESGRCKVYRAMTRSRGGTGCCSYSSPCCLQLRIASLSCAPYACARVRRVRSYVLTPPPAWNLTHVHSTQHSHTHTHTHTHTHLHTDTHTPTDNYTRLHTHTHVRRFKKLISWCQQVSPQPGGCERSVTALCVCRLPCVRSNARVCTPACDTL